MKKKENEYTKMAHRDRAPKVLSSALSLMEFFHLIDWLLVTKKNIQPPDESIRMNKNKELVNQHEPKSI